MPSLPSVIDISCGGCTNCFGYPLGHSNPEMLDLYYHLHDEENHNTMMELAKSHVSESVPTPNKGNLKATGQSKTAKNLQPIELQ